METGTQIQQDHQTHNQRLKNSPKEFVPYSPHGSITSIPKMKSRITSKTMDETFTAINPIETFGRKQSQNKSILKHLLQISVLLLFALGSTGAFAQESTPTLCADGIDNDGDGLVDYYDPECPCDNANYFHQCTPACEGSPIVATTFEMEIMWETDRTPSG